MLLVPIPGRARLGSEEGFMAPNRGFAFGLLLPGLILALSAAPSVVALTVNDFPAPTPFPGPQGIAVGPDGNLWFTEYAANQIGRVTPAGVITEFPIPTASSGPVGHRGGAGRESVVHRKARAQRRPDHPGGRRDGVPGADASAGRDRCWDRTAISGSTSWDPRSAGSRSTGTVTEFPVPTAGAQCNGLTAGCRRQSLVHGDQFSRPERHRKDRTHHDRGSRDGVLASSRNSRGRGRSPRAPTATSGSPAARRRSDA